MITKTAQFTGQGITEGKTYSIRKVRVKPVPLGLVSSAIVQDDDGYLYSVKNAHLAFDLKGVEEYDRAVRGQ